MRLTNNSPKEESRVNATLTEMKRNGFELVESAMFPGYYYKCRCIKCGHELKVNQHIWRFRHMMKCEAQ